MATASLADVRCLDVLTNQECELIRVELLTAMRQEQRHVLWIDYQLMADLMDVFFDPLGSSIANRDNAVLFAFALADHQRASIDIQVVETQVDEFHTANAC